MTDYIAQIVTDPPVAVMLLSTAPATFFFFRDAESVTNTENAKKYVAFLCPIIVFGVTFLVARLLPSSETTHSPWWPAVAISTVGTFLMWQLSKKNEEAKD